ncbi:sulfate adenylyltransferase [Marinobacter panjinensis]|uniref:Sulfate adenylyltransferase n=1 Tax=Marinobacter panjinensis TaxID=2576384 RepID=A0A4U6R0J2_9GAMM|nr:transglutaminase-like cysteine peptidase [Marinobacter panjinensis]MCR8915671.1 transglutaminase-like cysteine peptidase [Marinobacter panjinensis]TKV66913.1 sulfate adenylyltransferase [Marinobacter panjinensis]
METAALTPRSRFSLLSLLPMLLMVTTLTVAAFELGERLMDYVRSEFGDEAHGRLETWQNLHNMAENAPVDRQLRLVNSFFNRARFVSDMVHWGEEDYWATPVELLTTNGGDCEDFSIAKYLTLKSMGVPDEQLRIVYVKALELNQAHMVLAWYPEPDADPLILDNLINDIKRASQRTDLEPVYSFNGDGLWLNRSGDNSQRIGNAEGLSHWKNLNSRLIDSLR